MVYMNVTTSWRWRRPPVGIVRVERELAKYLRTSGHETKYCVLDASQNHFWELAPSEIDALLADDWCTATEDRTVSAPPAAPDHPLRRGARRLLGTLHPFLRDLVRLVYKYMRTHPESLPRAATGSPEYPSLTRSTRAAIRPTALDRFVSIGLDFQYRFDALLALKRDTGVTVVLGCYDTIPVDFPEFSSGSRKAFFTSYFLQLAEVADQIFAISKTTKADLERLLERHGLTRWPRIVAVPLGCHQPTPHASTADRPLSSTRCEQMDSLSAGEGFVLYVSTIESRKNHRVLVQVWRDLYTRYGRKIPKLVFVGMPGWGVGDLLEELRHMEVSREGFICLLEKVSDEALALLYARCLFAVFPSIYEGWGLGAMEALSYGKLCIISNAPALLEATQGMCPTLHPFDFPGWRTAVTTYWQDAAAREAEEAKIRVAFSLRTWVAFGRDFEALLRSA